MLRVIRNIFSAFYLMVELVLLLVLAANFWVFYETHGRSFQKISSVPPRETALVLGTSPKTRSGKANPYFTRRMDAAARLYQHGKVKNILVSGERSENYDEPKAMKDFLVRMEGIPEDKIIMDGKGFSTMKSINRAKKVYHKNRIIIVSQGYHNLRALFYARNIDLDALSYDARDVDARESYFRNHGREILARVQAVIYYLLGVE